MPIHAMDIPAKKRKAFWTVIESEAELDPLAVAEPQTKRVHTDDATCPPGSVFATPTGVLEDRFQLCERVFGSGQYGTVRECRDKVTSDRLACKTIHKSGDLIQTQEIRDEVEMMTRVTGHDNIVQLRGVFEDQDDVHLVMELCEGGELFDEILRRHECQPRPFTEREAALLFCEIVKAVAFCHSRGVMHRDLKPENILISRKLGDGESIQSVLAAGPLLKVADFGLSAAVSTGQKLRGSAGSPFYMAPEVLTGEYDSKADIWSLGVILYILLCGSPPFCGDSNEETFEAILHGKPDLTSSPWNRISPQAKSLVKNLLLQDPARRPSAQRVLMHPWLVGQTSQPKDLAKNVPCSSATMSVPVLSYGH